MTFDVRVDQRSLGQRRLRVIHVPHREFGQGNYTTAIKWGPMSDLFRGTDYSGRWVVIDTDDDGRYGLSIQTLRPVPD